MGRLGLLVASIVATLLVLELGVRAVRPARLLHWDNLVLQARSTLSATEQARFHHDDRLGVVPQGGRRGMAPEEDSGAIIVAVGDSFTYGGEVATEETWPAHLGRALARPVLNGGVNGYGFDQTVLRAGLIAEELRGRAQPPAAIVVSFIADDIRRTEMRRLWGVEKPYFDIARNELVLRNVPVPPQPDPATTLGFWRTALGYSYLVDFVLRRLDLLHDWFGDHVRVHPRGTGERISCLLIRRLADLQRANGVPLLLFAQYDPVVWRDPAFAAEQRRLTGGLLRCAADLGLATLDSYDVLSSRAGDLHRLYLTWHMSDAGNRLMAELVAASLARLLR